MARTTQRMTYERVLKHGLQVVSLPILTDGDDIRLVQWTPYAVPVRTSSGKERVYEIHYINHPHEVTCPYNDIFGNVLDPRVEFAKEYSQHIVYDSGKCAICGAANNHGIYCHKHKVVFEK